MSLYYVQRSLEIKMKGWYAREPKQSWTMLRFKRAGNCGKFGGKEQTKKSKIPPEAERNG